MYKDKLPKPKGNFYFNLKINLTNPDMVKQFIKDLEEKGYLKHSNIKSGNRRNNQYDAIKKIKSYFKYSWWTS